MVTTVVNYNNLNRIHITFEPQVNSMYAIINIHIEERIQTPVDLNKETNKIETAIEALIQSLKPQS